MNASKPQDSESANSDGSAILQPEEHVLSTLESDGSRRWLKPKLSKGKLLERRRAFSYILIAIFTLVPFIKIGGKPFVYGSVRSSLVRVGVSANRIYGVSVSPRGTVF
jgi:hypothetical protein